MTRRAQSPVTPVAKQNSLNALLNLHRLVGLSVVAGLLALAPAAHASPPDQSWIPGLYENSAPVGGFVTPANTERRPLFHLSVGVSPAPPPA